MSDITIWLTLVLMMLIIFLSRYLFLEPRLPIRLSPNTQHFLRYSAPAVLTAIWAPIVFIDDASLNLSMTNSYLWAGAAAALMAWRGWNTLLVVALSLALFLILEHGYILFQ